MSQLEYHYGIRSEFPGYPEAPVAVGARFLNTLDTLSRADPVFARWKVNDPHARITAPIDEARSRIAKIVEHNVKLDDDGPDPDAGYNMFASTVDNMDPSAMNISIGAGGKLTGDIMLQAGYYDVMPDASIVTYPIFKSALLAIGAGWPATWACAYALYRNYGKVPLVPGMPLFPYSQFHITWLAYLSKPLIGGLALPPDILTEQTPNGGLLMIAADERLDPKNPEHMHRARILSNTMVAHAGKRAR